VNDALIASVMTALERQEMPLLSWGVTDAGFTREELNRLVSAQAQGVLASDVVDVLRDRGLVRAYLSGGQQVFRTRTAEAVRLFASLRQWMGRDWQAASTLVADYRLFVQPKIRPARNIPSSALMDAIQREGLSLSTTENRALTTLVRAGSSSELKLSRFQQEATLRLLDDLHAPQSRGAVICAGTGTGKTYAFYIPMLTRMAGWIDNREYVRGIMLYPRNELLKDQFSSVFRLCRQLDAVTVRPIRMGAFFGSTPGIADRASLQSAGWDRASAIAGFVCPFLQCPGLDADGRVCGGQLVWRDDDLATRTEAVVCASCGQRIPGSMLQLTRQHMRNHPPDLLFTNVDQLSRRIGDTNYGVLVGVGSVAPRVVLLDEAHSYEGVHGAQVALTLRRWRRAVAGREPVAFVGLSATLAGADRFFAQLVGLHDSEVVEISQTRPTPGSAAEFDDLGVEYHLALRHDAASGASVLATTIQSAMLARRVLDPEYPGPSRTLFGRQVFCFAESLDLTNRLFHDLRDAEQRLRLASKRWFLPGTVGYTESDHRAALLAGQAWDMPRTVGHQFGPGSRVLSIGRVSSQDPGIDNSWDIVVATSSLEVGYDSDAVGAVLQHKAPRSGASFLQRVGRAGRPERMRPWKVVVLSDFGRDRSAFQSAEDLFQPQIAASELPVRNRYVLRMQCVLAFMDWLAGEMARQNVRGFSSWNLCSQPKDADVSEWESKERGRQVSAAKFLEQLMDEGATGDSLRDRLRGYLASALRVTSSEGEIIDELLWAQPRPLMRSVLPTLHRRLASNWASAFDAKESFWRDRPLPEFIPQFLSNDLNLPEVLVCASNGGVELPLESVPVAIAIGTMTPGNVTRRYAVRSRDQAYWIPLAGAPLPSALAIGGWITSGQDLGTVVLPGDTGQEAIHIVRPYALQCEQVPRTIDPSSRVDPMWRSRVDAEGAPERFAPPSRNEWASVITELAFCTHQRGSVARVTRASVGGKGQLRRRPSGQTDVVEYRLVDGAGQPAGLGFVMDCDGLRLRYSPPRDICALTAANATLARWMRVEAFRHRVFCDSVLPADINRFQRQHLADGLLAGVAAWAEVRSLSVIAALEQIRTSSAGLAAIFERAITVILRSAEPAEEDLSTETDGVAGEGEDRDTASASAPPTQSRRVKELMEVLRRQEVVDTLLDHAQALVEPIHGPWWENFLADRFHATLGLAMLECLGRADPAVDADDLILDLTAEGGASLSSPSERTLWITEATPGGTGIIERVRAAYIGDPGRFFMLLGAVLGTTEGELVDEHLTSLVRSLSHDVQLADHMQVARSAVGVAPSIQATGDLFDALASRGFTLTHRFRTALAARLLRPMALNAGPQMDALLRTLIDSWDETETRLGIELDPRAAAFLAAERTEVGDTLRAIIGQDPPDNDDWRYRQVLSMLWPRGGMLRASALDGYSRFEAIPRPDRLLVLQTVSSRRRVVRIAQHGWQEELRRQLLAGEPVALGGPASLIETLRAEALSVLAADYETGYLRLPVVFEGVRIAGGEAFLDLRLKGGLS
jgi:hypothetical protein